MAFTNLHTLSSSTLVALRLSNPPPNLGFLLHRSSSQLAIPTLALFGNRSVAPTLGFGGEIHGLAPLASGRSLVWRAFWTSINSTDHSTSSETSHDQDDNLVPMPKVTIDQDSTPDATVVKLSFGDRLGALLDTMKALKGLGLDVTKGTVITGDSVKQTEFFITRSGRKVEDPDMLEKIRLTIINNLLKYHPESSQRLALGEAFGIKPPEKKLYVDIPTQILVQDDGPKRSLLYIETTDRPGLLLEIIMILSDININVESAEIITEGLVAKDKFHVSYSGAALSDSVAKVLINCLRYHFRKPQTEDDSY
ncbi:ACT domain-containing protein ACR12 isoform X1 [Dioscorea cayenensis subsp. rotundata]|uniref:ACT domain-containing protein ACR n=1 Tax=Dioscorea cayennensis subsp. rotundata TaxID=55577 RepID=A0AB40BDM7_DIOCR|nr:ACT domain-containing protein ACR12 isoform X1 [Dioscorea cayenensis subsp. rotundata]